MVSTTVPASAEGGGMKVHIDRKAAEQLLDFGRHIGPGQRADEQLDGSVALYNTLVDHGVAYLADEVGMGKTYVALGVLALLRHYHPTARALVIAPRENIQGKWEGELRNVVQSIVRFADLRVRAHDGRPIVSTAQCESLVELAEEAVRDPDRDFFMRLPSFSLALRGGASGDEGARGLRSRLQHVLPWVQDSVLDLRSSDFKKTFAAAVNCILPPFDLVIIDEAHNLKHGRGNSASDRNQVLARVLGHPSDAPTAPELAGYKRLARWTLLLSATPVEDSYRHLWNQLDLVGYGQQWKSLLDDQLDEEAIKKEIRRFLIRRVTTINVSGSPLTKNLYRREWRRGGVTDHDQPIRVIDDRHRLVVALVQKKVSELLPEQEFGARFQIGMLASFESFLETSKLQGIENEDPNFDDGEQTQDLREREGLDVNDLSLLARSYRKEFQQELPHPKMDAVVRSLGDVWNSGRKALIFVRRVKSVKEIKARLDDEYDAWLLGRLERELPRGAWSALGRWIAQYRGEKQEARERGGDDPAGARTRGTTDVRGMDTFFAWFFRGDPRAGVLDGPRVRERYYDDTVFFEDNLIAAALACAPGHVANELSRVLEVDAATLRDGLAQRAARYLPRGRPKRIERFRAAQVAALDWLAEEEGPLQSLAASLRGWMRPTARNTAKSVDVLDVLETRTFFTELRRRPAIERCLWPEPKRGTDVERAVERLARGAMLSACARLGHAFVDLYEVTIRRLGDLSASQDGAGDSDEVNRISDYLEQLEHQMAVPVGERGWRAFDELSTLASHFDLICRVNKLDLLKIEPAEVRRAVGVMFGRQQPIGGMAGFVNATLVHQFRQPGYPLVLVTTDVLQEGEDLHTFCSTILHYGISWTPSAMEQRTGRIDRIGSATDRRLGALAASPTGEELLQVHYPYLEDTVEVLQVDRVFERMNTFLRLMHRGLRTETASRPHVDVAAEMARGRRYVEPIREVLDSAFGVAEERTHGELRALAVPQSIGDDLRARFLRLTEQTLPNLEVRWKARATDPILLGTVVLGDRTQPIALYLRSVHGRPMVRCISPVGELTPGATMEEIRELGQRAPVRIGAIFDDATRTYDVTVEGEVLLADEQHDRVRVASLISRVATQADRIEHARLGLDQDLSRFEVDLRREEHDAD
jgi:hypothetical protein